MKVCQMDSKFRVGMNVTMRPGTALYTRMTCVMNYALCL